MREQGNGQELITIIAENVIQDKVLPPQINDILQMVELAETETPEQFILQLYFLLQDRRA